MKVWNCRHCGRDLMPKWEKIRFSGMTLVECKGCHTIQDTPRHTVTIDVTELKNSGLSRTAAEVLEIAASQVRRMKA